MRRSDISFATDDAHAFLPWVIGIMACMATLLLCLGVTAGGWIEGRHQSYAGSFTVNIPATIEDLPGKTAKIREAIKALPGVTGVSQISESALHDMLKPWLGNSDAVSALPLPAVLEATINEGTAIDYGALQARLSSMAPGTELDTHERWIASFGNFSAAVQWLLTLLAVLIVGSLALMVSFTSRAALKLHAKTVQLLHSMGAEDGYIARQFQREAALITLRGAVPGCIAAGLAYWAAGAYMASLPASLLPTLAIKPSHLALLLLMPPACGIVAWAAARLSVLGQLQRSL